MTYQPFPKTTVSVSNSTTVAISTGTSFTGEWEDVTDYESLVVAVKTDQNGTFSVQFSPDGTNQDSTLTRYYRTDQIEAPHRFTITRQFARVVFTNDSGTNQGSLRLQTMFGFKSDLNAPMDSTLSQDFDATCVRPTDFNYEVALGQRQGKKLWNKFGYNTDIDVSTSPEVVAHFGGSFTPLKTASVINIVSTDAADTSAGTGAQTIRITGLDANRDEVEEDFTMNGTTNVTSATTWLGINRAVVLTSGSGDVNAGLIAITETTGATTQATIPIGESVTQQLIYFTPRNHQGLADWLVLSGHRFGGGTEPVITFKGWVYSPLTQTKYEVLRDTLDESISTELELRPSQPFVFTEQDVFWIEATTTRDDTNVYGRFSLIQVRDVDA